MTKIVALPFLVYVEMQFARKQGTSEIRILVFMTSILAELDTVVPAAEIQDHETGLVSGPFSWFQSRQLFLETHETDSNSIS